MIPSKFELRDVIAYLVPSTILMSISYFLCKTLEYENPYNLSLSNKFTEALIVLSFLYILGFYLRYSFNSCLKFKRKGLDSKILEFLVSIFLGKPNKKDLRKSKTNNCIKNSKWKTVLRNQKDKDQFYIIKNYVSQNASASNLFSLERAYMSFTLAHRMTAVFFTSTILTIICILKIAFKPTINTYWTELILILIFSIIMTRISFRQFQKFYDNWCKRNIRIFIALNELKER